MRGDNVEKKQKYQYRINDNIEIIFATDQRNINN